VECAWIVHASESKSISIHETKPMFWILDWWIVKCSSGSSFTTSYSKYRKRDKTEKHENEIAKPHTRQLELNTWIDGWMDGMDQYLCEMCRLVSMFHISFERFRSSRIVIHGYAILLCFELLSRMLWKSRRDLFNHSTITCLHTISLYYYSVVLCNASSHQMTLTCKLI